MDWLGSHKLLFYSLNFDFKIWFHACQVTGTFEKRVPILDVRKSAHKVQKKRPSNFLCFRGYYLV